MKSLLLLLIPSIAFAFGAKPVGSGISIETSSSAPATTSTNRVWVKTSNLHLYFTDSANVDHDLLTGSGSSTAGYSTVQQSAISVTSRAILNFTSAFNCTDATAYSRTDCDLANSTAAAGTYTLPSSVTVNAKGIVTGIASGTIYTSSGGAFAVTGSGASTITTSSGNLVVNSANLLTLYSGGNKSIIAADVVGNVTIANAGGVTSVAGPASFSGYADFAGITAPSLSPASGSVRMYYKTSDSLFHYMDSTGAEKSFGPLDSLIVHLAGIETLTGRKTFTGGMIASGSNAINFNTSSTMDLDSTGQLTIANTPSYVQAGKTGALWDVRGDLRAVGDLATIGSFHLYATSGSVIQTSGTLNVDGQGTLNLKSANGGVNITALAAGQSVFIDSGSSTDTSYIGAYSGANTQIGAPVSTNLTTVQGRFKTAGYGLVELDSIGNSFFRSTTGIVKINGYGGNQVFANGGAITALEVDSPGAAITSSGKLASFSNLSGLYSYIDYHGSFVGASAPARLMLKEAGNSAMGVATMVAGTVTITNSSITANSRIWLQRKTAGGVTGDLTYTLSAGTSFTVNSSSGADTSTFNWTIIEPSP